MKATDILRSEHTVILSVLGALEKIAQADIQREFDLVSATEALDFLRTFADRCHHTKEEKHFFPALTAHGLPSRAGPIAVMLADHDQGRAYLARMAAALDELRAKKPSARAEFTRAALSYVDLMRDHIDKENGVLFPMGDEMLTAADQTALVQGFEHMEHADMEAGAHERFLGVAEGLRSRFGIVAESGATAGGCCGHKTPCKS